MIPILFEKNATAFTTNGLGWLPDCTFGECTEERNGLFEVEFDYPITGKNYDKIALGRIVLVQPAYAEASQPFEIYEITKPINGIVNVRAKHISYRLNTVTVKPFTATTVAAALLGLKNNSANTNPFTFWTDKSTVANFKVTVPQQLRGLLGGQEGSILDVYGGGEYKWDGFTVKLYQNRGQDRGVTLRYGKNITDLTDEASNASVYTGIVPYYYGNETLVVVPEVIYSSHRSEYPYDMVVPKDFTQNYSESTIPTVAQLRAAGQSFMERYDGWQEKQNIKVSFVNLADTEEYKDIAVLERVNLCDTVTVYHEKLGTETQAKVVKTVYNFLAERYKSIELGEISRSLGETIESSVVEEVPSYSVMEQAIANGTRLITGNNGGYVVLKTNANGKPEEILVMDTEDVDTATKVWRFNNSGLGYSSTGYNGTYKQAWTIDGGFYTDWVTTGLMTANIIKAGILSDKAGKNSWNMVTGAFELNAAAKVGNTGYTLTQIKANAEGLQTKVEANGVISAINQSPESITINANKINFVLGKANNKSGKMSVQDENGNEIGSWNKDGITATAGTIGGWTIGERVIMKDASDYRVRLLSPETPTDTSLAITAGGKNESGSWVNNFYVRYDGYLYATNANITGTITATAGSVGGWSIASGQLHKTLAPTASAKGYRIRMLSPASPTGESLAISVGTANATSGAASWSNKFNVRYDGYIYAVGGGRIGAWTLGAGENGALYNTRNALYTNKNGVYIGTNGIAVGGSTKTGNNYAYFEANTAGSIVYINQLHFRNEDGSTSAYGWNVDGDHLDRIHTGGAIDVNSDGGGTTYLRGKNEINGYQKSSDRRIKSNIKTITAKNAKKFIMALRPVSHTYKKKYKGYYLEGIHHALIAQEAREAIVDGWALVSESDEGILGIRYDEIVADVIALMQEQQKRIDKLEEKLNGHTDRSN